MNRLIAFVAALVLSSSMLVGPTMATTDSGAYGKHLLDCLGMLFGDPKAHLDHCGPFDQPPFWFPTGGSGPCSVVGEVSPFQLSFPPRRAVGDGYLEARAPTACDCSSLSSLPWQSPDWVSGWGLEPRILLATPLPPC